MNDRVTGSVPLSGIQNNIGSTFAKKLASQPLSGLNPVSGAPASPGLTGSDAMSWKSGNDEQSVLTHRSHVLDHNFNGSSSRNSTNTSFQGPSTGTQEQQTMRESPAGRMSMNSGVKKEPLGNGISRMDVDTGRTNTVKANISSVFSSGGQPSLLQLQQGSLPSLINSGSQINAALLSSLTGSTMAKHHKSSNECLEGDSEGQGRCNSQTVSNTGSSTNGTCTPSYRVAQACDRCRAKKIRCDGKRPQCSQCAAVGFECKVSDKLSRRSFPRGYTETLEERVRELEAENRRLVALCDLKEEQLHLVSKFSGREEHSSDVPSTEDEQMLQELSKTNGGSLRLSSTNLYLLNKKATPVASFNSASSEPAIPVAKVANTAPSPRIMSPRDSVDVSLHNPTGDHQHNEHPDNDNSNQPNAKLNAILDPYGISFEQNEAPGLPAVKALSSLSKYKQGTQLATLVAVSIPRTTEEILFVPQLLARIGQVHGFTSKQCLYTASVLASLKENTISPIPPELEILKNKNLWEIDDVLHFWKNVFKLDFMTHTAVDYSSTHLNFKEIEEVMELFFEDWYELIPLFDKHEFDIYYEKFKTNVTDPHFFSRSDTIFNNRTRSISYKIFSCLLMIIVQMGLLSKIKRDNITEGKFTNLMKYYDKLMTHIWLNPYFNSRNTSIQVLQSLSLLLFYMLNVGDTSSVYELRGKVVSMSQQLRLHRCPSAVLGGDGSTVSKVQQGERRILFWSIYYLDAFSALQLGVPRLLKDIEIECALPVTSGDDRQVNLAGQMIALEGKVSQFSLSVIRFAKVMGNILDSTFKRGMTTSLTKQAALVHENALDNWRHGLSEDLFFQLDVNGSINMDEFNRQKQGGMSPSMTSGSARNSFILMALYFMAKCMIHLPVVATKPLVAEAVPVAPEEGSESGSVDRSLSSYVLLQQATNTLLNVLTALKDTYLALPINLARTKTRFGLFSARGSLEYAKGGALFQDNKALLLDLLKELETDKKLCLPSNLSWHSLKLLDLSINLILQPANYSPQKVEKLVQKKISYYNKLMGQPGVPSAKKKRDRDRDRDRDPRPSDNGAAKKVKLEEDFNASNVPTVDTGDTTDTVQSEDLVKDVPSHVKGIPGNYNTIQEAFQMDPVLNTNPFSNADLQALFSSAAIDNASACGPLAYSASNGTLQKPHVTALPHGIGLGSNDASLLNLSGEFAAHGGNTLANPVEVGADTLKDATSMTNLLNLSNSDSLFKVPSNGDFLKDYYINSMSGTGLAGTAHTSAMNKGPSLSQLGSLFMSSGSGTNLPYSNVRGESKHGSALSLNKKRAQPALDGFSFAADASLGLAPLLAWSPDAKTQLGGTPINDSAVTGIVLKTDDKSVAQDLHSHSHSEFPFQSADAPVQLLGHPAQHAAQHAAQHRRGPRRRLNGQPASATASAADASVSDLLRWQNRT